MFRYDTIYKVVDGDDLGVPSYWNPRFLDVDVRLNAVEAFTSTANLASQVIIDAGIARIDTILQPAINAAITEVNTLTASVATLQNTVLTDQNNLTTQLNSLLAQAQGLVANLSSLGTIDGGTF